MKMKILILFFSIFVTPLFAQNSSKLKELEQKRKTTLEQIAGISKMLNQTKQSSEYSLQKLKLLESQIESRKKLIQLLNDEMIELGNEITTLEGEIIVLEKELNQKKGEYGKSVQLMFMKRSSYEKLMFIFSSHSLNQAYRRARYLKEYAIWSRLKGEEIILQQTILSEKKAELQKSKAEKQNLLVMRQSESKKLQEEESRLKVVVETLKKRQKQLQTNLIKQKRQAAALDQQIQHVIQEEIRRAQEEARRAHEEALRKQRLAEEAARKREADELAARKAKVSKQESKNAQKSDSKQLSKPDTKLEALRSEPKTKQPTVETSRERKADIQGGYMMTREEKSLSDDFSKNRGSLPVPVTGKFMLIGHYGQQQREDLKYVVTNNNGVDLQAMQGADARSIFGGVVSKVFAVPGYNSSVIIRHGNYLSVYSNLSSVYVSAGDRVTTRQNIGKIYSDPDDGNHTVLHFQIWKETNKLNPEVWINF